MSSAFFSNVASQFAGLADRFLRLGEMNQAEPEASRIRAVRLATVLRATPWTMAANIGNAGVTLLVFAGTPQFPAVSAWAFLVIIIALTTGASWWRVSRRPQRRTASLRGTRSAVIHTAVLSGLWALLDVLFFPGAGESQRIVLVALTIGMTGGSGFALATVPPAVITFGTVMVAGAGIALIAEPGYIAIALFLMFVFFVAIVVRASFALCEGLSGRVRAQLAADEQRDVIGLLLNDFEENAADWLWAIDDRFRIDRLSPRFFELTGRTADEVDNLRLWEALPCLSGACHAMRTGNGAEELRALIETREPFRDFEIRVLQRGTPAVWSLSAKPIFDASGRFAGYRGVGRDVTAQREQRRRIEYMARHDALTDLGNRVLLNDRLAEAFERLYTHGETFALMLLDLDRFKQVNDVHGHGSGDELLRQIGRILRHEVTDADTLARIGGDEFVIVHRAGRDRREATTLAERVKALLERPFTLTSGTVRIGVSIGIACAPADGQDAATLMRHADLALYRAKTDGRNRFRFFEPSLDAAARRRNQIEQALRDAVARGGLNLHYQPLVDTRSRKVVCVEALLRWHHPDLGPISPAEFISIAEEVGLIGQIGAWVIREASRTALAWPEPVKVAINLSPAQFATLGLFQTVRAALAETGLPPGRLEFEVTESLLLNSNNVVESTLVALSNLGVSIALDDFGTGYSSLSYLRKYRFDKLKIDQSFISDIERNHASRAIVEAVIKLGRDLGMRITAEGVETAEQFELLTQIGCNQLQGYFIARPLSAEHLAEFVRSGPYCSPEKVSA